MRTMKTLLKEASAIGREEMDDVTQIETDASELSVYTALEDSGLETAVEAETEAELGDLAARESGGADAEGDEDKEVVETTQGTGTSGTAQAVDEGEGAATVPRIPDPDGVEPEQTAKGGNVARKQRSRSKKKSKSKSKKGRSRKGKKRKSRAKDWKDREQDEDSESVDIRETDTEMIEAELEMITHNVEELIESNEKSRAFLDKFVRILLTHEIRTEEFPLLLPDVAAVCGLAALSMGKQDKLLHIHPPLVVVTDSHGQVKDTLNMFAAHSVDGRAPWQDEKFLFLGDYVDRGLNQIQNILLLLALHLQNPKRVILLRGNHEDRSVCNFYGFSAQIHQAFPIRRQADMVFGLFIKVFERMPLCAVIGNRWSKQPIRFWASHGGFPRPENRMGWETINEINNVLKKDFPNGVIPSTSDHPLVTDILWSDPGPGVPGFVRSSRGAGFVHGEVPACEFQDEHNFAKNVRGHQAHPMGFEAFAGERLISVFFAANYSTNRNLGSTMHIDRHMRCKPNLYMNVDHLPNDQREWEAWLKNHFKMSNHMRTFTNPRDAVAYDLDKTELKKPSKPQPAKGKPQPEPKVFISEGGR